MALDETHDPALRSFVASANDTGLRLPDPEPAVRRVQRRRRTDPARLGIAIGDRVLDLARCRAAGLFAGELEAIGDACGEPHR